MLNEEFNRDLTRSVPRNPFNEGGRSAPITVTPLSASGGHNPREPVASNGSSQLPGAAGDHPRTPAENQRGAIYAQNTAEMLPVGSSKALELQSPILPRKKGYFRTAMQYLREIEVQSAAGAHHEATSSSLFGQEETKRLRVHERTAEESVAKQNSSSKQMRSTIAASLAIIDSSTARLASEGPHRFEMGLDEINVTEESSTQSQQDIATLAVATGASGSGHNVIIPGEGQPEETYSGASDWIVDSRDSQTNSLLRVAQGSGPGLDDLDLLADTSSPLNTQIVPIDTAEADLSPEPGSPNIESTQVVAESNYSGDATEIASQTPHGLSDVRSLGSPEERSDDFPEFTDEDWARIDAISNPCPTTRRDVANSTHAIGLGDALTPEDSTMGAGPWFTDSATHPEGSRQRPSPSETKSHDFPEFTDEDWSRIDALSDPRPTTRRYVANRTQAIRLGDTIIPEDSTVAAGGWFTGSAAHPEGSRHGPSSSETKSHDFPEFTDEDWAGIDAISKPHSERSCSEQDVGQKSHSPNLNKAVEEMVLPSTISGADQPACRDGDRRDAQDRARVLEPRMRGGYGL
ncbi:hypothetical protein [Agrobacterium larrymoorei]|uniref:Protein virD3 n=1 Tax=Agrobacterium larrymoorei TaxID=160699 RepID=A0A4D7DXH4_9HYPH|nr:hypothetical protein [Agrobacterium larrymoorei]QCJ00989.1 hypothetical protein CFBP5473_23745 [Agrobacterium larrymoorei]QYA10327.1 hypothetical protein J5285_22420 [Agrobacterium larrymoorei]